jgi:hypothetical protein
LVFGGQDRGLLEGPGDVEVGVVPEDGAFALGAVVVGGFVEDFGAFGEDEEAVGDPELFAVFGAEFVADPLTEGGGALADVYGYVEDAAAEGADEFALGLADLVVEAA